ncbi:MAG TPA: hypothetical protein VHZ99_11020 [Steroidobacteraceae bacterium]|nr:hypothetical protein [Steroidobacteraceae bacterium]
MTTLQFNCIGSGCGLLSSVGAGLTAIGHTVCGVTLSVLAASASVAACVRWFRARPARSTTA